MTLNDLLGS